MRPLFVFLLMFNLSFVSGKEFVKKLENLCIIAVREKTDYQVLGNYGSSLETEWHPAAAYVLLNEMNRFGVLRTEFQQKNHPWRFDFLEMSGGKTIVFVYNSENRYDYCNGPNAFYVVKK